LNSRWHLGSDDEDLPRACAQPPRRRNTRAIVTRVPRHSRLMTTDPPPNGAAYADEGDANLLLSFHVCLTRKHAMPQVHSRFRDMPAKHRDGRDKRPRHEVSACPSCHACIYHLYTLQAFFHYASAWLLSPDQGLGSVTSDEPRSPRAHPMPFHCSMYQYATHDCALHRNWSTGGPWPSFRHREPPSRTPRTLGAAMRMVAQRPAMVHRVGRAVLLDVKCPLDGCP
jgi:hypothetical protein